MIATTSPKTKLQTPRPDTAIAKEVVAEKVAKRILIWPILLNCNFFVNKALCVEQIGVIKKLRAEMTIKYFKMGCS